MWIGRVAAPGGSNSRPGARQDIVFPVRAGDVKGVHQVRKQDLVRDVAEETGQTEAATARTVNAVFAAIERALAKGDDVTISGFGSFKVVERSARRGRNPQTGDPTTIEARKSPVFRPGTQLKRVVRE